MNILNKYKKKIFEIIQIGHKKDFWSTSFDVFITIMITISLIVTFLQTFDELSKFKPILGTIELITIWIFVIEYILRIWTSNYLYEEDNYLKSIFKFLVSFYGIIDLLTIISYFAPSLFTNGFIALRMLRVVRILRLFRINSNYDAFHVITSVLRHKKDQIASSIFMILIMMLTSSMLMYSLEHEAQPENFRNAFSGIWWSVSTLLTVGYGDIYPITVGGRIMAIIIAFLGVGMVAIPTGIISAGFVEHYTKLKMIISHSEEKEIQFVTSFLNEGHSWNGKKVKEIDLPPQTLLLMVIRNDDEIIPRGDLKLISGDKLVLVAKNFEYGNDIQLKEIIIKSEHPWVGYKIKDLDISRLDLIISIQRKGKSLIPNGNTIIRKDDIVIVYSKHKENQENDIWED